MTYCPSPGTINTNQTHLKCWRLNPGIKHGNKFELIERNIIADMEPHTVLVSQS